MQNRKRGFHLENERPICLQFREMGFHLEIEGPICLQFRKIGFHHVNKKAETKANQK